ncbi:hypothetical protein DMUE_2172 [Dictyocoela muelleri]|nr:hypothetical protein DMUE_2172 [Dictyocoela muelleri]
MNPLELQEKIESLNDFQIFQYLFDNKYLMKEYFCYYCKRSCFLRIYKRSIDSYGWRCLFSSCANYKKYSNIRKGSFFENLNLSFKLILKIILFYSARMPRLCIINYMFLSKKYRD